MENETPKFPDYGEGGDVAGARRARRAFRVCVFAILLFSIMMWFSEGYLRHERSERLFLISLDQDRSSARPILIQAIKHDAKDNDHPTPKYSQALAVREEADVILRKHREAYLLDTTDTLFALRYGCQLYKTAPEEAAAIFREAAALPPKNGLLAYLEAASLAKSGRDALALEEAMVIVARANNAGDTLVFPKPIWFSPSVLPQDGAWYAELSRDIYREACEPLYDFAKTVVSVAKQQAQRGDIQNAKLWLEHIRLMGDRLFRESEPLGARQSLAGIYFQQQAYGELEVISVAEGEDATEPIIEARVQLDRLNSAADRILAFEAERHSRIEALKMEYVRPLSLVGVGALLLTVLHLFLAVLYRIARLDKSTWTIPHGTTAKVVLTGGTVLLFFLLHVFSVLQSISGAQTELASTVALAWWVVLGIMVGFGFVYPLFTLPAIIEVCRRTGRPEEIAELLPAARRAYRVAFLSLSRRYYGLTLGIYICLICAWAVSFRMVSGLYPELIQWKLLTPGLLDEEIEVVREAIALLH